MHVWRVKKIEDDRYHVVCKSAMLDEEVDGGQFMGMLKAKHLERRRQLLSPAIRIKQPLIQ
jgi:hypothetical protein